MKCIMCKLEHNEMLDGRFIKVKDHYGLDEYVCLRCDSKTNSTNKDDRVYLQRIIWSSHEPIQENSTLIFEWRNNQETRLNSLTSDLITREDHDKWLAKKMYDVNCKMFFIMHSTDLLENKKLETKVGIIRLDYHKDENAQYVNININPRYRGQGYGKTSLTLIPNYITKNTKLIAQIKPTNIASIKAFTHANYKLIKQTQELNTYEMTT